VAIETYERVLQSNVLPEKAQAMVQRQYDLIRVAKNSIEAMSEEGTSV
jgi:hypothetical protein